MTSHSRNLSMWKVVSYIVLSVSACCGLVSKSLAAEKRIRGLSLRGNQSVSSAGRSL